jgi:chromosome segregation ATPase
MLFHRLSDMVKKREDPSELISVAEALDGELRRFEELSENIQRASLTSEKNLGRASHTLKEIADVGEALQARLGAMVAVIAGFRDRQEMLAKAVQAKAEELQERSKTLESLLERYRTLGEDARQLNQHLRAATSDRLAGKDEVAAYPLFPHLQELDEKIGQLADNAQSLVDRAQADDFPDVAHQADALRQQLQAVRNKLGLLRKNLPQA